jgi:Flp pilus assembly protein TadD
VLRCENVEPISYGLIMLKRNLLFGTSVFLFVTYCVVPAMAQFIPPGPADTGLGGINSITGMVLVSSGGRIQRNIAIRLETMTSGDRVVFTDENGNFSFRGLPPGDYTLRIEKEKEYEPFAQVVSVVQPRGFGPQSYNVSIRLKPKAGSTGKAGVVDVGLAGVPKDALDLFNKAAQLAKSGDRVGAIDHLQRAIKAHPQFVQARSELGVQYLKVGQLEKADAALAAALELQPDSYTVMFNRGIVLFHLKRFADAVPLWKEVVKIKEQDAAGHYYLGQSLANIGKFVEAEKELLQALELGGDEMVEARRLLAIIYVHSGDNQRAAAQLERYLKVNPKAGDAEQLQKTLKRLQRR